MKQKEALRIILDWVSGRLSSSSIEEQIRIYDALSHVLTTSEEWRQASEIAVTLSEVAKLQLDFTRQLFSKPRSGDSGLKIHEKN
jgi:hypothetical protein